MFSPKFNKVMLLATLLVSVNLFAAKPKNIIVMIGDGMGVTQVTTDVITNPNSAFKRFKISGFSVTCSADALITDSGAGGTAIAVGERTYNGAIGVDKDAKPVKSLLELAKELNKSAGVVVTSSLTDATPADFTAHVKNRKLEFDIAEQQSKANYDVMIGGGLAFYTSESIKGGKRNDGKDLVKELSKNYKVYTDAKELLASNDDKFFGILDGKELVKEGNKTNGLPKATDRDFTLQQLTDRALKTLNKNPNGFAVMVEGSQIDWGCHGNDQKYMQGEIKDFSGAVNAALDFAEKDGNTLVIVLADHETGGTVIEGGTMKDIKVGYLVKHHSAAMIGVFAYGPGAEEFGGINDNYVIGKKLQSLFKEGK